MVLTNRLTKQPSRSFDPSCKKPLNATKFGTTNSNTKVTRQTNVSKANFTQKYPDIEPEEIYNKITLNQNENSLNKASIKNIPSPLQKLSSQINFINSIYSDLMVRTTAEQFVLQENTRIKRQISKGIQSSVFWKQKANKSYKQMVQLYKISQHLKVLPQKLIKSNLIDAFSEEVIRVETENYSLRKQLKQLRKQSIISKILPYESQKLQKKIHQINKAIQIQMRMSQKMKRQEKDLENKLRGTLKSCLKYDRSTSNLKIQYLDLKSSKKQIQPQKSMNFLQQKQLQKIMQKKID